MSEAVMATLL